MSNVVGDNLEALITAASSLLDSAIAGVRGGVDMAATAAGAPIRVADVAANQLLDEATTMKAKLVDMIRKAAEPVAEILP